MISVCAAPGVILNPPLVALINDPLFAVREFVFSASPETIQESLWSFLHCPVGNLRDLAACASKNPDVFVLSLVGNVFHAAAVPANSSAGTKSIFLRSTASIFRATASVARLSFPRSFSFS
jgi:hypothetical protein